MRFVVRVKTTHPIWEVNSLITVNSFEFLVMSCFPVIIGTTTLVKIDQHTNNEMSVEMNTVWHVHTIYYLIDFKYLDPFLL